MTARRDLRAVGGLPQGPAAESTAPAVERIRDHIAECQDVKGWLDLHHPEALDLCARATDELRDELHGVASALAGPRPEKYFREQLRGEHPLTLLDVCRLTVTAPAAIARMVSTLAQACGYDVVRSKAPAADLSEAHALLAESSGDLQAKLVRATRDGRIDESEDRDLDEAIRALEGRLAELKAAKDSQR